ncbi:MAG: divalent metal cation transporter [Leptospiraceae bacterium]|jgi:Mn2+/Fe2+ NRAMP family transporter|nr:divalent metal cation transporter [Leptospiraceae bacterium]MCZ8345762.1 divalent metal cation transporter [Leptospiraceae bacterium]
MKLRIILKNLGPGLLYAGAAVGVSHLVQSTRAGAMFGFDLVAAVLIVNFLKYPFFEIGTTYTVATGNVLLEGYKNLGRWSLWVFLGISVGTMFIIIAVVTMVTAGLVHNLTGIEFKLWQWSAIILGFCIVVLVAGKYKFLDSVIRLVILLLTISTFISLCLAIYASPEQVVARKHFDVFSSVDVLFLVALLGWMPIPIEAAVWQSDWTLAAKEERGSMPSMQMALIDFKVGYWGTTILALAFLSLGAIMMHGSGTEFSANAVTFSDQLVQLISKNLGLWAYPFIATAAFLTMFSTSITCIDAYPRVVARTWKILYPNQIKDLDKAYWVLIVLVALGAVAILIFFQESMKTMVDFATTISFVTAPIIAFIHFKISRSKEIQEKHPSSLLSKVVSWLGLVFLTVFALYYCYIQISKSL